MSSTNNSPSNSDITLDELGRLIRMLGMLGSDHEGEVLAAARFAVKWVREKGTDWETLLTPEPEQGVTGVATVQDQHRTEDDLKAAFDKGFRAGTQAMAAQVKAQAAYTAQLNAQAAAAQQTPYAANQGLAGRPGTTIHNSPPPSWQAAPSNATQPAWTIPGATNPHAATAPSWQYVAWALLARDAQGIPGVFRGSREQTFVADLLTRGWPNLTPAQDNWLRDIAGRSGMTW